MRQEERFDFEIPVKWHSTTYGTLRISCMGYFKASNYDDGFDCDVDDCYFSPEEGCSVWHLIKYGPTEEEVFEAALNYVRKNMQPEAEEKDFSSIYDNADEKYDAMREKEMPDFFGSALKCLIPPKNDAA